jgi:hypothetical protein
VSVVRKVLELAEKFVVSIVGRTLSPLKSVPKEKGLIAFIGRYGA